MIVSKFKSLILSFPMRPSSLNLLQPKQKTPPDSNNMKKNKKL
jgi:hypothetical protein